MGTQIDSLKQKSARIARGTATSPLVETLIRLGYIVRGLVYGVMGVLAMQVAITGSGTLADSQGAIATIGKTAFGGFLLYLIFIGLIGYAIWGIIRALFDPLHKGNDVKGMTERVSYFLSGLSYGLLALATYRLIVGGVAVARNGAQTVQTQHAAASILSYSWGIWVVGIAALVLTAGGVVQIVNGLRGDFDQTLQPYTLSSNLRKWVIRLARFGTAARGIVFMLVGLFLLLAAYQHDANRAQGVDGVLATVLHQAYGSVLLGVVALGLIAFGIYSTLCGVWLRLKR